MKRLVALILASVLIAGCAVGSTPAGSAAPAALGAVATATPGAAGVAETPPPTAPPVSVGTWANVPGSELVGTSTPPMAARLTDGGAMLIDEPRGRTCLPPDGEPDGPPAVVYDPSSGTLSEIPSPSSLRGVSAMTVLADGRVLVAGGMGPGATPRPETSIWDPATGGWTDGPPMSVGRTGFGLLTLRDGRVLAVGGEVAAGPGDGAGAAPGYSSSAEILDPATNTWSAASPIPWRELPPVLVALEGGGVLALPVKPEHGFPGDPMLYHPETGQWTAAPLPDGMDIGTKAVALPDGSAIAVGPRDLVRFDPASGWQHAGRLGGDRYGAAIAGLGDGRILVAGGESLDASGNAVLLETAEVVDPATGVSAEIARMPIGRSRAVAVQLADGSVLVAGGNGKVGVQEEYVNDLPCTIAAARAVRWVP